MAAYVGGLRLAPGPLAAAIGAGAVIATAKGPLAAITAGPGVMAPEIGGAGTGRAIACITIGALGTWSGGALGPCTGYQGCPAHEVRLRKAASPSSEAEVLSSSLGWNSPGDIIGMSKFMTDSDPLLLLKGSMW
eukprot:CAMPEP_0195051808 /NCGR_PEP_ID=MMETSP0448-20130528/1265_1 /TAXON_ID=66468 /ORGANISM="Heterocapsa triquestra, Strain CCMP 448" /LENGTH=133 /DNA_ID=CAMNT_0040080849 /DNA_START=917 /DNA_END=1315 /DNA_ORIENTATION=+